ncbi:hypothetical protein ABZY14_32530 [Streptomyces sp. NPDC006617]|uniref:hypothetical protein n=1 Tax=Streptomyces sp. NPDC006617 TaxID=3155354 RepID=UPI0033AB1C66
MDDRESPEPAEPEGRTARSELDEAGSALVPATEGVAEIGVAAAEAAADLVAETANALEGAAAGAAFEGRADAAREAFAADGPPDGAWQDGDPPDTYADDPEGPAYQEPDGDGGEQRPNPWLNLKVGPPTDGPPPDGAGAPGGSGDGPDDPDDHGAPHDDGGDEDDEDRSDIETKELKIEGFKLEPNVDRMRGADWTPRWRTRYAWPRRGCRTPAPRTGPPRTAHVAGPTARRRSHRTRAGTRARTGSRAGDWASGRTRAWDEERRRGRRQP